jgi:hypothetical protein
MGCARREPEGSATTPWPGKLRWGSEGDKAPVPPLEGGGWGYASRVAAGLNGGLELGLGLGAPRLPFVFCSTLSADACMPWPTCESVGEGCCVRVRVWGGVGSCAWMLM